jgi:hypothetical protein
MPAQSWKNLLGQAVGLSEPFHLEPCSPRLRSHENLADCGSRGSYDEIPQPSLNVLRIGRLFLRQKLYDDLFSVLWHSIYTVPVRLFSFNASSTPPSASIVCRKNQETK